MPDLESPEDRDAIYQARGTDAEGLAHRPLFTGDVLRLKDGREVALLQHPCSMRQGTALLPRLLVALVRAWNAGVPSDWSGGNFRRMFLPDLDSRGDAVIDFVEIDLITADDAISAERIAVLSQEGVNLLVQRWLHHQSRVAVPTLRINEMIAGQFDEADLTGDAVSELVDGGMDAGEALAQVDAWLDAGPPGSTMRKALTDAQKRSTVRTELRKVVREWARG